MTKMIEKLPKILGKIYRMFKKDNKSSVIIPSKMGLPTMKVCAVVLVDAGPGCPTQGLAFKSPNQKTHSEGDNTESTLKADSNENLEYSKSIVLRSASQDLKNSLLSIFGISEITFGKVVFEGGESEATKVVFDPQKTDFVVVLGVYASSCGGDCAVFYEEPQKEEVLSAISGLASSMPIFKLVHFSL